VRPRDASLRVCVARSGDKDEETNGAPFEQRTRRQDTEEYTMLASTTEIISVVALVVAGGVGLTMWFVSRCVKIVQQGSVGVVKRFGEFKSVDQPGLRVLRPFVDKMEKVDMREFPMTGDQQAVITRDNVSLQVSATIFCQVIDVKSALFEINDYQLAVDQLSRTALRAVIGEMSLDQALSERETINSRMQDHMADATVKWGVRLNRIEILDITPPANVVQAMSEQKEAEQHKKAAILKSEGEQQSAINGAGGRQQAAVLEAQGAKEAAILQAEAEMKVLELQAEGEKKAFVLRGEGEAARLTSLDTATINPRTLAVLQLRALQDIAASDNAKVVVPYEATSLMGAAEVLLSTLRSGTPDPNGLHGNTIPSAPARSG
jgi:regulator of protease activity HflC (stomatin/prohibitin superfamily)